MGDNKNPHSTFLKIGNRKTISGSDKTSSGRQQPSSLGELEAIKPLPCRMVEDKKRLPGRMGKSKCSHSPFH